ncbi:MupA/Atu3671 family FMN-dependent luciferase-like monooxygenase [Microvirga makkahensis]|uniref:LLM class flavin-dependent oxidoreductase n=1 Tax=Microvirga makkahensis TaxID=1128670 RepID=A0A7X3SQN5_9HYPH|nr:MupA/Atu3671 family FMN-dependent luciferase-like monooxygenase [Microvirga makkahensis]MXQ13746.1 LLM class flavin-dependent oxidoreductase [Microvirga makkahensis]
MACALIGADTLLTECGELLLQAGHEIVAVVAGTQKVASWAAAKGLTVIDGTGPGWIDDLKGLSFDWLFSITHLAVLPSDVLALPRKGAINFHDGLLPRYAGLNTPAWTLMEGASTSGITWHLITQGIDEGDIIASRTFEIDPAETSLSINTRNFGLALDAFEELIEKLAGGIIEPIPQSRDVERVVYRRSDRPKALCLLDWSRPAQELERLVRALDFGPYSNPLGRAAIRHNGVALSVTRTALYPEVCGEPGDVVAILPEEIVVACGSGGLGLKALTSPAGAPVGVAQAVQDLRLSTGVRMDGLDDVLEPLTELGARLARHEQRRLRQLVGLEPVSLPWARTAASDHEPRFATYDVAVPAALSDMFGAQPAAALVAGFSIVLSRLSGKELFHLAAVDRTIVDDVALAGTLVSSWAPFEVKVNMSGDFIRAVAAAADEIDRVAGQGGFLASLVARDPDLSRRANSSALPFIPIGLRIDAAGQPDRTILAELVVNGSRCSLRIDDKLVAADDADLLVRCFEQALAGLCANPAAPVGQVDILGAELRKQMLVDWNARRTPVPDLLVHRVIEQQVDRSPDAVAVIFEDETITYGELDRRANQLAACLQSLGVAPDDLVGIHVERGIDLVVSMLAVLKAGGAYLPLDPAYPADRLQHMIADSSCQVILTSSNVAHALPSLTGNTARIVQVDGESATIGRFPTDRPDSAAMPGNLCYCIYTSGSTGLPKGVLIEHRNVINFFTGMDERVDRQLPATWFAVTSLSFDISVLELLYTLSRGFQVVIYRDRAAVPSVDRRLDAARPSSGIDFSLFYFSGCGAESDASGKYRLLLEGARWADANGFCAVWTPERHFHAFGGLYPEPSVTAAAVAAVTQNVSIRAGSVVLPLHHPVRVAEAWSVVDNLSNGRAGISIASGWQPDDFILMPENYAKSKDIMFRDAELVKRLWRGEKVAFAGPLGKDVEIQVLPRPVQPELPLWVTTAGNPETFEQAGRIGANLLTHLLGQSVEQLAPKIAAYRKARAEAGFDPDTGIVSLMLHTFVSDDEEAVREIVREPLKAYLGSSLSLLKHYAWTFPAFKKPRSGEAGGDELAGVADDERDAILEFAFLRYYETSGLFGTPESAARMVASLKGIGIDEIACLVDFGIDTDTVLANLPHLGRLQQQSQPASAVEASGTASVPALHLDQSLAAQLIRHRVTHLQCTPSMARLLTLDDRSQAALAKVANIFIGGEAFPVGLARELSELVDGGRITNMYGPTETTIWSTTWPLQGSGETVPIGTPIANNAIYILDAQRQPLPPGVPGELWIGGEGVARGYHQRPELSAERFVADPFRGAGARMYRTGDLAKWRRLGNGRGIVEFLGRVDHQVKIRGYRIELGEIEACLAQHPAVRECVVVARPGPAGDQQLVAFLSARTDHSADAAQIRAYLRNTLPEAMVPAHLVVLPSLPHTLNGKIDRKALPELAETRSIRTVAQEPLAPEGELERTVLAAWHTTLGDDTIRVDDNFFDVGGHSLLVVRLHRHLREILKRPIFLTDLYRFPTVRSFVQSISSNVPDAAAQQGIDRAARRRQNLQRRGAYH